MLYTALYLLIVAGPPEYNHIAFRGCGLLDIDLYLYLFIYAVVAVAAAVFDVYVIAVIVAVIVATATAFDIDTTATVTITAAVWIAARAITTAYTARQSSIMFFSVEYLLSLYSVIHLSILKPLVAVCSGL